MTVDNTPGFPAFEALTGTVDEWDDGTIKSRNSFELYNATHEADTAQ